MPDAVSPTLVIGDDEGTVGAHPTHVVVVHQSAAVRERLTARLAAETGVVVAAVAGTAGAALKATRENERVRNALAGLQQAARGTQNLMDPILEAARAYATLGEMCDALREVWGEYEEPPVF